MRALLVGMDRWVQDGDLPPASRYPTLSAGTLIDRDEIKFPEIPGVQWPYHVSGGYRSDLPGPLTENPLPFLVSDVDDDGNEVDGFVLPGQASVDEVRTSFEAGTVVVSGEVWGEFGEEFGINVGGLV